MVEVDDIYPQKQSAMVEARRPPDGEPGSTTSTYGKMKPACSTGQATVQDGDTQIKLKGGHELLVADNAPARQRASRRMPTKRRSL